MLAPVGGRRRTLLLGPVGCLHHTTAASSPLPCALYVFEPTLCPEKAPMGLHARATAAASKNPHSGKREGQQCLIMRYTTQASFKHSHPPAFASNMVSTYPSLSEATLRLVAAALEVYIGLMAAEGACLCSLSKQQHTHICNPTCLAAFAAAYGAPSPSGIGRVCTAGEGAVNPAGRLQRRLPASLPPKYLALLASR